MDLTVIPYPRRRSEHRKSLGLLTASEVCRLLQFDRERFQTLKRHGKLPQPTYRLGEFRRRYYHTSDLETLRKLYH